VQLVRAFFVSGHRLTILRYQLEPTPPIPVGSVQAGDTFVIDQTTHEVLHRRGMSIVGIHATNWPGTLLPDPPPEPPHDGFRRVYYEKEKPMPGQNVSMTGVMENSTTGAVTLKYSNGTNSEYASWADVGALADSVDANSEFAEKILAAIAYRNSPDGTNKENQVGASLSVNVAANVPVVYTPPE
jgi:hypothetical protein